MYLRDTIAAISTPAGEGGIGIVRVSGPDAERIAARIFRKKEGGFQSHLFYYGAIVEPETGFCLDEAMAVLMHAPRSYTREDVLELHSHGGTLVVQNVLQLALREGARLAEPGEFTRRAFLNGRIDLAQAEAVIDIIRSKTDLALEVAQSQREGSLSHRIGEMKGGLVQLLALLEAHIDFPEEDIEPASRDEISARVAGFTLEIGEMLATYGEGRILREGIAVLIAGRPNVGKSSLLNSLLREKRAIVTSIPGTTRDIIEEVVNIRGIPLRLMDTAGIRETEDLIEQEGVRLTREQIPRADLILFIVDASLPLSDEDLAIYEVIRAKPHVVLLNKSDLLEQPVASFPRDAVTCSISALTGEGLDALKDQIADMFLHGRIDDARSQVLINNSRHRDALERASIPLQRFSENYTLLGGLLELLAADLREAVNALGEITGETSTDDLLDLIFSQFCIGK
ncbi:MAG: tRNA uridine-5-carboxymethylaminomethyl(34) synthesis GTPase MnmE [Geobacter sp.]|nr:tRNA uridine-5-carboxymethylaminomethyl(34) synthesis GTPase MnmE [Geobacter sp.]